MPSPAWLVVRRGQRPATMWSTQAGIFPRAATGKGP